MSNVTRDELRKAVKARAIKPLYLLYGEEDYLRDAAARAIAEATLTAAPLREFNESGFSLANTDVQVAIATMMQLPMMTERRVVRITNFARLREADEAALLRYVARPADSAVVIFVADDLDKRRKLTKALLEACSSTEFAPLNDADLLQWARSHLKELQVEADDRTLRHLIALVGNSVRRLSNELAKLATAALPSSIINIGLVESLASRSRELSNFDLADHLIARNRVRALQTLNKILDDGAEPVMLIGLLASNYHRLLLAKELMQQGAPTSEVFRLVGLPFSKREDFLATARRSEASDLARQLARIAAADLAIKTSQATPRLQLELLVCELSS